MTKTSRRRWRPTIGDNDDVVEPVSLALKFAFLAILYLFLLWVARSTLRDLRRGTVAGAVAATGGGVPADATGLHTAAASRPGAVASPRLVVDRVVGHPEGASYALIDEVVLGRGDVEIPLEDPFASSRHARLIWQGGVVVLEDLGSTNGTYLNDEVVDSPRPLHPGDRVRIGDSSFHFEDR